MLTEERIAQLTALSDDMPWVTNDGAAVSTDVDLVEPIQNIEANDGRVCDTCRHGCNERWSDSQRRWIYACRLNIAWKPGCTSWSP